MPYVSLWQMESQAPDLHAWVTAKTTPKNVPMTMTTPITHRHHWVKPVAAATKNRSVGVLGATGGVCGIAAGW